MSAHFVVLVHERSRHIALVALWCGRCSVGVIRCGCRLGGRRMIIRMVVRGQEARLAVILIVVHTDMMGTCTCKNDGEEREEEKEERIPHPWRGVGMEKKEWVYP